MKIVEVLLTYQAVQSIGWALLHSLWQGAIIAVLLSGAMNFTRKGTANFRYITAYTALMLVLILPVLTVWMSDASSAQFPVIFDSSQNTIISPDKTKKVSEATGEVNNFQAETAWSWEHEAGRRLEFFMPWLVLAWSLGVFASGLRLSRIWADTRRLKRKESQKVLERWQENLERLCRQLRVKKSVLLLESSLVRVPTVVGWLKPLILFPPSAILNLTPQQLEAILAHELAHIRRHDYLANFLQTVVETLLFYHPAARWISRRIRAERENACDDLAVSAVGDALCYARALTKVERLRKTAAVAPPLAMAADGGGSLSSRIHRLLEVETASPNRLAGIWTSVLVISALAVVGAGANASSLRFSAQENVVSDISRQNELTKLADARKRAAAICSLGKTGDAAVIPVLIRALSDDETISKSVGCWKSDDWSPRLETFKQPSPGEEAAIALASMSERAFEPLVAALKDSNPIVRRNAAWAIGEIRDGDKINRETALEPLIRMLRNDEDAWARRAAAFALSELKDSRSAPALINSLLRDKDAGVREMAANALGEIKEQSAFEPLETALKDFDERVSNMARWALDEIKDR